MRNLLPTDPPASGWPPVKCRPVCGEVSSSCEESGEGNRQTFRPADEQLRIFRLSDRNMMQLHVCLMCVWVRLRPCRRTFSSQPVVLQRFTSAVDVRGSSQPSEIPTLVQQETKSRLLDAICPVFQLRTQIHKT